MNNIIELRHLLHENAELSGKEVKTNAILNEFLEKLNPDLHIRNIGGNGIALVFKGKKPGKRILVRGDIDAPNQPKSKHDHHVRSDANSDDFLQGYSAHRCRLEPKCVSRASFP